MARNFLQEGNVLNWTNGTGSDVSSGDPVAIGDRVGVALVDIADGESGSVQVTGVFQLPKVSADVVAVGATVYLDSSGEITTTEGTNTPAGFAWAAAADGDTAIEVKLNA